MHTLFFGSIGTLAETSCLQLEAYNEAFAQSGLDWHWSEAAYQTMLLSAGGYDRVVSYAQTKGDAVDAAVLHRMKSEIYRNLLRSRVVEPRPGVIEAIDYVKSNDGKLALVTSTSQENVRQLLEKLAIPEDVFELVVHSGLVTRPKPQPDAYLYALDQLNVSARDVLSVEDNPDGALAATRSGTNCLAVPGSFHDASNFVNVMAVQSTLSVGGFLKFPSRAAA
ncbi:MAG: HAD-IA family hydrolase [Pseudomonadota bacterium]